MIPSQPEAAPPPKPGPASATPWKTLRLWERFGPRRLMRKLSVAVFGHREPKPRKSDPNNYPLH
jgi:hypothetical protein